jgi:hypothetical protein
VKRCATVLGEQPFKVASYAPRSSASMVSMSRICGKLGPHNGAGTSPRRLSVHPLFWPNGKAKGIVMGTRQSISNSDRANSLLVIGCNHQGPIRARRDAI